MSTPEHDEKPPDGAALLRMVDFRIPLPWLLSGFGAAVILLASMYFQMQTMSDNLKNLQITVQSGNTSWATLASKQALLEYRIEALEAAEKQRRGETQPNTGRR